MSTTYIGVALRREVIARANNICAYCRIHEDDTFLGCHVDHIVSEKHGGLTITENLALACTFCNLHKGSDLGSLASYGVLTRFYHPRTDDWAEHFELQGAVSDAMTAIGDVTARILRFNNSDRLLERQILIANGDYPR